MLVLVACEYSGRVREAFRARGHDAWSCDLLDCEDGSAHHIKGDALAAAASRPWDLIIAHPPCTHLAVSGARHFAAKRADGDSRRQSTFSWPWPAFQRRAWLSKIPCASCRVCGAGRIRRSSRGNLGTESAKPHVYGSRACRTSCLQISCQGVSSAYTECRPAQIAGVSVAVHFRALLMRWLISGVARDS